MIVERFLKLGEYAAAGAFEEPDRNLFYRKALALRRYYEHCELNEYHGEYLYPSGPRKISMRIYAAYLNGLSVADWQFSENDKDLLAAFDRDFRKYKSSVLPPHTVAGNMWTHSMPNYERILKEGFNSYAERIQRISDKDLREGLLHLIEGIRSYQQRCVSYLKSVGADEKLISALEKVPFYPAENIYEALVGWNFVLYLDGCDNLGCIASGLTPYYKGENVVPILQNLYDNLDKNEAWSMSLGIDYSPLTLQCLEASKGKRRPMIELFVTENTPNEVWKKAFEVIRTNNGQPAFYNPKILLDGLQKRFPNIPDEDVKKFCGGGCTETMLAGLSNVGSLDAGINLLYLFENHIYEKLNEVSTFEEFYESFIEKVLSVEKTVMQQIIQSQKDREKWNPQPMRTLLIDDCIDKGMDFNSKGARYRWSLISFAGMINVIDGFFVIKDYVFDQHLLSAKELQQKLKENDLEFLKVARTHPVCFGIDNEQVNTLAKNFSSRIYEGLNEFTPYLGGAFLPCSIQFSSHVSAGQNIGATPDGREKGAPLCDSLAAIFGKDIKGPTALLKSVASLDLEKALGVPVLNFNVKQNFNDDILKALILGYMQLGGAQIQITCADAETLQKAYENPELYRNLVVRVGGFSEYFCNLSDGLKKMVIQRTIQEQV